MRGPESGGMSVVSFPSFNDSLVSFQSDKYFWLRHFLRIKPNLLLLYHILLSWMLTIKNCTNQEIENETHFLTRCPKFSGERDDLFNSISAKVKNFTNLSDKNKLFWLLNCENNRDIYIYMRYNSYCDNHGEIYL
jgi:hypothetical protein